MCDELPDDKFVDGGVMAAILADEPIPSESESPNKPDVFTEIVPPCLLPLCLLSRSTMPEGVADDKALVPCSAFFNPLLEGGRSWGNGRGGCVTWALNTYSRCRNRMIR